MSLDHGRFLQKNNRYHQEHEGWRLIESARASQLVA